jgi:hypothetical protein
VLLRPDHRPATFAPLLPAFSLYPLVMLKLEQITDTQPRTADLVARYMVLTKEVMPDLAKTTRRHWPVRNDHCFQRIVLDAVCTGVWYDHIARPAYKNLTCIQAADAVTLCEAIIAGHADLEMLNAQSLAWRGKGPAAR